MAQLGLNFNANDVPPQEAFSILPAGKYRAQIIASEMRPTSKGDGQYLWLELEILDGEHQGRKTWDRLNIINPNPQAQDIAQRSLSAICHALGKMAPEDSEELHFQPMTITVRVRPARGDYAESNEIRGYEPVDSSAPRSTARPTATAASPTARPAATSVPAKPWARKQA